jgi:hypothetical protein
VQSGTVQFNPRPVDDSRIEPNLALGHRHNPRRPLAVIAAAWPAAPSAGRRANRPVSTRGAEASPHRSPGKPRPFPTPCDTCRVAATR